MKVERKNYRVVRYIPRLYFSLKGAAGMLRCSRRLLFPEAAPGEDSSPMVEEILRNILVEQAAAEDARLAGDERGRRRRAATQATREPERASESRCSGRPG